MIDTAGVQVGVITFTEENGGVRVSGVLRLGGVAPTRKGFHVHEIGECAPPDFESAGGHFDPHGRPHGGPHDPPTERHVGDLGNVEVDSEGFVEVDLLDRVIALHDGQEGVVGRALLAHEEEDDLTTQPAGDAGSRIACGVIER